MFVPQLKRTPGRKFTVEMVRKGVSNAIKIDPFVERFGLNGWKAS